MYVFFTIIHCQVRKLEFQFAEAISQKCDHVITSGSPTSNHCRVVAACARQLGIQPHLVMKADVKVSLVMICTCLLNRCNY